MRLILLHLVTYDYYFFVLSHGSQEFVRYKQYICKED